MPSSSGKPGFDRRFDARALAALSDASGEPAEGETPDGADESLRTFILEVSAGRPQGVGDATAESGRRFDVLGGIAKLRKRSARRRQPAAGASAHENGQREAEASDNRVPLTGPKSSVRSNTPTPAVADRADGVKTPQRTSHAPGAAPLVVDRARRQSRAARRSRLLPVWTSSLALHGVTLAALAAATLSGL